jgi:hypothetical protein
MAKSDGGVAVLEAPETQSEQPAEKRLNLILSAGAYSELAKMAERKRTTMTEIVRQALGLLKVAIYEAGRNHKLVVTTEDGKVLKELILPE